MDNKLSLYQLTKMVKDAIVDSLPLTYWIVAEISDIKVNRNGHCYMELIESDKATNVIIAKSRAVIWARSYRMIKPYFEMTTGRGLESGMKVLVNVSVDFHELFGFSLNIKDIDPSYTIGDIEQKRKAIIQQLKDDGVIDMNKELELPNPIQRIAVISSETAAGFGDFIDQLLNTSNDIKFYYKLFPAIMQGSQSESSIMNALDSIYEYEEFFDCVVIIRGGGSKSDLSCFDSYDLAYYITQFTLPVITGIGHEQDDSIVDVVANTRLKTPTAVANFIIEKATEIDNYILALEESVIDVVTNRLDFEKSRIEHAGGAFIPIVKRNIDSMKHDLVILAGKYQSAGVSYLRNQESRLDIILSKLKTKVESGFVMRNQSVEQYKKLLVIRKNRFLLKRHHKLEMFENSSEHLNPEGILKRGYSLTYKEKDLLKSSEKLKSGDIITTQLAKGVITSKVYNK